MFKIDRNSLLNLAEKYCNSYQKAQEFPHIVIDNFLAPKMAEFILENFPQPNQMDILTYQKYENKIALSPHNPQCPSNIELILNTFNSSKFIGFLENLTSINGLIPDPHFVGSGFQQVMNGGKLGIHVDFNYHKGLNLYRRLNVLIYFNKNWQDEYGGHLELWDRHMQHCIKKILPIFNRCVIFETSSYSWHGHPDPIQVPEEMTRKSIVLYYYTSNQGSQDMEAHWTRHRTRPNYSGDRLIRPVEKFLYNWTPPATNFLVRKAASKIQQIINYSNSKG